MAHRFSSMKSVLSTLMDGGDGQKAGISQSSVPSWGQKPRAQDQGRHRSQGMGQSPTGHFFFFFWYRDSSSEWARGILGKGKKAVRVPPIFCMLGFGKTRWIKEYPYSWKGL